MNQHEVVEKSMDEREIIPRDCGYQEIFSKILGNIHMWLEGART